jgi:hypothetical protein
MSDVNDIPDVELIRRVISGLRRVVRTQRGRTVPLWTKVGARFCLGSTYAAQLCRRFDFNPDEQVRP